MTEYIINTLVFLFWLRQSHGRNFVGIYFRITDKVRSCRPMYDIEKQQNLICRNNVKQEFFITMANYTL